MSILFSKLKSATHKHIHFFIALLVFLLISCSPDSIVEPPPYHGSQALSDITAGLIMSTYIDLDEGAKELDSLVTRFAADPSEQNLAVSRQAWKNLRVTWEQSECFAFGPVITMGIYANLFVGPINKNDLDAILSGSDSLTSTYVSQISTTVKGFHAIEYLLFGINHRRQASSFTARELQMLKALTDNFKSLTYQLRNEWEPAGANFVEKFSHAGMSGSIYPKVSDALMELLNSMIGICDELANSKIEEPLSNRDPSLAESQYSDNTLEDYKNNLLGVQYAYLGSHIQSGVWITNIVKSVNPALDSKIRLQIFAAINALSKVPEPFSKAIITSPKDLKFAQTQINKLRESFEQDVTPIILEHTQ